MKARKTTTRHYHLRQTRRSGKVPVRQHPMNYWGVTAIARGKRKREMVSKSFTTPKQANSFKRSMGPHWSNPRVVRLKDSDRDGVPDVTDCAPFNPKEQGIIHDLSKASKYVKMLAAKEKQELHEKLDEIDEIIHNREFRERLTREEKTKILHAANAFKREHPLVTASIKGMVLGGAAISLIGFSGGAIRLLLRPQTIAAIARIRLPGAALATLLSPPKKIAKERFFARGTVVERIKGLLSKQKKNPRIKGAVEDVKRELNVKDVFLTGSRAIGEQTRESDIDLTIPVSNETKRAQLARGYERKIKEIERKHKVKIDVSFPHNTREMRRLLPVSSFIKV